MEISFKKWLLKKEMAGIIKLVNTEMVGTGAILKNCRSTATYNVWGACSDLKQRKDDSDKKKMDKGRR